MMPAYNILHRKTIPPLGGIASSPKREYSKHGVWEHTVETDLRSVTAAGMVSLRLGWIRASVSPRFAMKTAEEQNLPLFKFYSPGLVETER